MIRRPPRSTRTDTLFSLHDALPISPSAFGYQDGSAVVRACATYARPSDAKPRQSSGIARSRRSEEHTSELQSLMRISYAVFCLKKKKQIETRKIKLQMIRQQDTRSSTPLKRRIMNNTSTERH